MYQGPCEGVRERGGERVEEVRREQLVDEARHRVGQRQCKGVPEGVFDTVGERLVQLISEAVGQACGLGGRAKGERRIRRREERRWMKVHVDRYEDLNTNKRALPSALHTTAAVVSVQYPQT